jgi:hypothetical protein
MISKSYQGAGLQWVDLSSFGNNVSLQNGVQYLNSGSFYFDGINDYIVKSSFQDYPVRTLSIGVWARILDNANPRYLISFGRDVGGAIGGIAHIAFG